MAGFTKPRLVIVGGSVGGLFLGNILMRGGWHVDIFERVTEELASRGAGIAEHAAMVPIMAAAGIVAEGGIGIEMPGRTAYDRFGTIIARYPYPQYLAAWSLIFNPLRAAFPREHYHQGRQLVGITRRMRSVAAHFADGGSVDADLIVGADRRNSRGKHLATLLSAFRRAANSSAIPWPGRTTRTRQAVAPIC